MQAMINNPNIAKPHHFITKTLDIMPVSDTYYDVTSCGWRKCKHRRYGVMVKSIAGQ